MNECLKDAYEMRYSSSDTPGIDYSLAVFALFPLLPDSVR